MFTVETEFDHTKVVVMDDTGLPNRCSVNGLARQSPKL